MWLRRQRAPPRCPAAAWTASRMRRLGHLADGPGDLLGRLGQRPDALRDLNAPCVAPELLEAVELALLRLEDVDDDVTVVEQYPRTLTLTFTSKYTSTRRLQRRFDLIDDRRHLPRGTTGGHHEEVRDDEGLPHIQHDDVGGLLLGCCGRGEHGKLLRFQHAHSFGGVQSLPMITMISATFCCVGWSTTSPTPNTALTSLARARSPRCTTKS